MRFVGLDLAWHDAAAMSGIVALEGDGDAVQLLARQALKPRMTSLLATGMPRLELTETLEQFLSENLDARRGAKRKAYEDALGAPWRYARPESPHHIGTNSVICGSIVVVHGSAVGFGAGEVGREWQAVSRKKQRWDPAHAGPALLATHASLSRIGRHPCDA